MTAAPLEEIIRAEIREHGPMPVARYMALALGHPRHGYYTTRDPLGTDFTTSPEISQMFGELIGAWAADIWTQMGAPKAFHLVELGPGRGTLMADALRAAAGQPGFAEAARLHLVDLSPVLRGMQERTLGPVAKRHGYASPTWHADLTEVPDGPAIVIANEFFDALPVRQFIRTPEGWRERCVAVTDDGLALVPAPAPLPDDGILDPKVADAPEGSIAEICPAGSAIAAAIAARIATDGGAALLIDYGYAASAPGDTLQAMRGGGYVDVLDTPGDADITAHVDFGALAGAARENGAEVHGPTPQGEFLARLGIGHRAEALARNASQAQVNDIEHALARLTGPDAMGTLFKVLALTAPSLRPAGFETA